MITIVSLAQTPGMIIKPASGAGTLVLDPDGDGYVSQKTNGIQLGFTVPPDNDVIQSEIPYVALVRPDVQGDLQKGPAGGFTEIVGTDAAGNNAVLTYSDDNYLYYRFRLSGYASNSKSYSILIDTDQKFGFTGPNKDDNAVVGNPGFEVEIVLETNFNVKAFNVDGSAARPSSAVESALYETNCQKSIAVSKAGGDMDYFYDFYLPYPTTLFTKDTPLRYVALTSINPMPAIGNNGISDVGGVGEFGDLDQAFMDLIDAQTPTIPGTEVLVRSFCPTINGPITTNSTAITGTSTEGTGTIIKIYKNGSSTPLGETIVDGATWIFTLGGIELLEGDIITATATASGKGQSIGNCNPRIVLAQPCSIPPRAINLELTNNNSILNFNFDGGGATYNVEVYIKTKILTNWTLASPTINGTTYTYNNGNGNDYKITEFYVDVSKEGCKSTSVYCSSGLSVAPTITTPVSAGNTSISGTCGTLASVIVYINDVPQEAATYTGTWTKTIPTLKNGDILYVTAKEVNRCIAYSALTTTVTCSSTAATPVITGNVFAGDNILKGTCEASANITVFRDGVSIGAATVNGMNWSIPISSLVANTTKLYVTSQMLNKCDASSNEITVKTVPVPVISGTYCGTTTSVSGYISGTTANIRLYKESSPDVAIGVLTPTNSLGYWTISGLNLTEGDQIYAIATLPRGSVAISSTITIGSKTANIPIINTNPIYEGTTTTLTGTGTSGDNIKLYVGGALAEYNNGTVFTPYTASWSGNTWTISNIAANEFYLGASVYVTATAVGQCESDPSSIKIVQCVPPVIPTYSEQNLSYCKGSSGVFTLSPSQAGVIYQLVNASGQPQGLEYVGTGGSITLKTYPLYNPLVSLRVKAYKIGNPSCSDISTVAINFTPEATPPTVNFTSTNLTASYGDAFVNLNFSSKSTTPAANQYAIDYPIATNALGLNDIPTQPFTANSGSFTLPIPTTPGKLPIGTYYGTITISSSGGSSCSTVYGFSITINAVNSPPVIVNQYPSICSGNTASLIATATGSITSYQWQSSTTLDGYYANIPEATSAAYKPTLTATTYYKVVVNGVPSTATTVTVNPLVSGTPTILGTSTVCAGQNSVNYSVSGISNATSYTWSYSGTSVFISGNGNSIYINFGTNATSGALSVAGTNSCGSGSTATYPIIVNPPPTAVAGEDLSTCSNSGAVNITSGASAYNHSSVAWTSSGTAGTIDNANSLTDATYSPSAGDIAVGRVTLTLIATGNAGCGNALSTKQLTIAPAPVASAGSDITKCTGTVAIAMTGATASGTYTGMPIWSGGAGEWVQNANPELATFTPTEASGSFTATLTLTGANGCTNATDSRTVTWGVLVPTFTNPPGANSCAEDNVVYSTQSGMSNYAWSIPGEAGKDYTIISGGVGTSSYAVTLKWLTAGSKTVTVNYTDNGCTGTAATSTVIIHPLPVIGSFN